MFWYVQQNSFGGKGVVNSNNPHLGVATEPQSYGSEADKLKSCANAIEKVCERFRTVQIEHLDYETVFEKYDSPDTVFYCDPPYVDVGDDYYQTGDGGFNHQRFVSELHDLDGKWLISYDHNIPPELQDYTIIDRQKRSTMDHQKEQKTESLVMNFDTDGGRVMSELGQSRLEEYR